LECNIRKTFATMKQRYCNSARRNPSHHCIPQIQSTRAQIQRRGRRRGRRKRRRIRRA